MNLIMICHAINVMIMVRNKERLNDNEKKKEHTEASYGDHPD